MLEHWWLLEFIMSKKYLKIHLKALEALNLLSISTIFSLAMEVNYMLFVGIAYNDGISVEKQFTHLNFNSEDKILLRFDKTTKSIGLEIFGKQKFTSNFKIVLWEENSFKIAFLLQGKDCKI